MQNNCRRFIHMWRSTSYAEQWIQYRHRLQMILYFIARFWCAHVLFHCFSCELRHKTTKTTIKMNFHLSQLRSDDIFPHADVSPYLNKYFAAKSKDEIEWMLSLCIYGILLFWWSFASFLVIVGVFVGHRYTHTHSHTI